MSDNRNGLIAIVYYNGSSYVGPNGQVFEGENKMFRMPQGCSYRDLMKMIYKKLRLQRGQSVSRLTARCASGNPVQWVVVDIVDDDDVALIIDACVSDGANPRFIELYAELNCGGQSSSHRTVQPDRSIDINREPSVNPEDRDVSQSPPRPTQPTQQMAVDEEMYISAPLAPATEAMGNEMVPAHDPVWPMDSSEDEVDEGVVPDGDSSDTDVDGDFERGFPIPSPGNVGMQDPMQGQGDDTVPFWSDVRHYTHVNWAYTEQQSGDMEGGQIPNWQMGQQLYKNQVFETKRDVKLAIKQYCMADHRTAVVEKSDTKRLIMVCENHSDGCPWRMRAYQKKGGTEWVVGIWNNEHTCVGQNLSQDHKQLDSDFICSMILEMIRQDPSVKIGLIQERIASVLGFHISYTKAWKAKQKAIVKVFGDWDESYAFLPRWLGYMLNFAPGSAYKLDLHDHFIDGLLDGSAKVFNRVFWTFKQCCDAFNYCKPVISIDGTHLYGKYRGTLLIATTVDGNNYVLPIALAIVSKESIDNWSWFLALIRIHVTQKLGICLISDRHAGIIAAVNNVDLGWHPPRAYHVYCIRHLASNFNHKFSNVVLKKQLKKLAYTTSRLDFDAGLEKFKESSPQIAAWIDNIPKEKWSIAYDEEGRRFGHMTTNLSECFNKVLKGARSLPITSLVRFTYARLVAYFVAHGQEASEEMAKGNHFSKVAWQKYTRMVDKSATHYVTCFDSVRTRFEVQETYNIRTHTGGKKWTVLLAERNCQCGEFTAYRFPCSHVIAACRSTHHDPRQYVDPAYSAAYQCHVYAPQWYPIGNEDFIPPASPLIVILDVTLKRKKGRPNSTRIRKEMDSREGSTTRTRCGYCKVVGHNRRNCPSVNQPQ